MRFSTQRADMSHLDNLDKIKRKAKYSDVAMVEEYLGFQEQLSSKDLKELDNIMISNTMFVMVNAIQKKDLVKGIGTLAMIIAAVQLDWTLQALALQLTDQAAEYLDTKIEMHLANIEKRLEEKTVALLIVAKQAQDTLKQAVKALENAAEKLTHSDFSILTHNNHVSNTTITHNTNSYTMIVHNNLLAAHYSNIAKQ